VVLLYFRFRDFWRGKKNRAKSHAIKVLRDLYVVSVQGEVVWVRKKGET